MASSSFHASITSRRLAPLWALASVLASAACSGTAFQSSPADLGGDFSVALTNGNNGCMFMNWTPGSTAQDVHLDIMQQGSSATATVTGVAGLVFDVVLGGSPTFEGTITGTSFTMTANGTNSSTDGQCAYTIKATLTGTIDGDTIQGQLSYAESTNGSSDCGYHATCTSVASYAGARPPPSDASAE